MGDKVITGFVSVLLAIVGVATLAVIVSKQSDTASVLKAGGGAFSSILGAALGSGASSSAGGISLPALPTLSF